MGELTDFVYTNMFFFQIIALYMPYNITFAGYPTAFVRQQNNMQAELCTNAEFQSCFFLG